MSGQHRKPPTPPKGPGGVSPKTTRVVVSVDTPAVKKAIAAAVARAVNEAAKSLREIREWCDSAAAMTCSHTTEDECRRCEVIKDCALAVRTLLPPVPPASDDDTKT